MSAPQDNLLTSRQVRAKLGGISAMTLYRWHRDGTLPEPTIIRGRKYWQASDIERVVAQTQLTEEP